MLVLSSQGNIVKLRETPKASRHQVIHESETAARVMTSGTVKAREDE